MLKEVHNEYGVSLLEQKWFAHFFHQSLIKSQSLTEPFNP